MNLHSDWIKFRAPAQIGVLVRELRRELDDVLLQKVFIVVDESYI
jgi:hypothetical protein